MGLVALDGEKGPGDLAARIPFQAGGQAPRHVQVNLPALQIPGVLASRDVLSDEPRNVERRTD
jgi:hypothetical protein